MQRLFTTMFVAVVSVTVGVASPSGVLSDYLQQAKAVDEETFQRGFPHDRYLDSRNVTDFRSLEEDRTLLNGSGRNGDQILLKIFERYLVRNPPCFSVNGDAKRAVDLADGAFAYGTVTGQRIYRIIGYQVLDDLSDRVKAAIKSGVLAKNSREAQYLVGALAEKDYYVMFPKSWLEKLLEHIWAGDWNYIADRIWRVTAPIHSALLVMFVLSASLILIWRRVSSGSRSPKKIIRHVRTGSSRGISLQLLVLMVACVHEATGQTLSERIDRGSGDMTIRKLYYGNDQIGHTIWIARAPDRIKATYFASGNVFQRYSAFKQNERIAFACEGAFSGATSQNGYKLEGLSVDAGHVLNRDRSNWDGLVLVFPNGGIAVSDIGKENLTVTDNDGSHKQELDLLKAEHKDSFFEWAKSNRATAFQTQLLASRFGLRIDVNKARTENRERRILALVGTDQGVFHIIFDVNASFYLGPVAKLIYDYLDRSMKVYGLLNLDTGDFNIQRVYTHEGIHLTDLDGPVPIEKATNLLVYYYR